MNTLICTGFSPFSQRARWALDVHGIPYRTREHIPMLGSPGLRWRTGRWRGLVSVPVLLHDGEVLSDSLAIAEWSAARATGPPLIDDANRAAVHKWTALGDDMCQAGRLRVTRRVLADRAALRDSVPASLRWLGPAALPAARMGAHYLLRKYPYAGDPEAALRTGCERLRAGLDGHRYLVGDAFSFADIAMAVALEFVSPIEGEYAAVAPASRAAWSVPELVGEFAALLDWRDELFRQHRAAPQPAPSGPR